MNKSQSNYFNMCKAVCDLFGSSEVWTGNELVEENVIKIGDLCLRIGEEATNQYRNRTSGYTDSKERARTQLEDRLYHLATRLKVYAMRNKDSVLSAQVGFPRSALDTLNLNTLLATARTVAISTEELAERLDPYKITQKDVDDLRISIAETEELNAHRDAVRSEHIENTAHLTMLFAELRTEFKLMDTLVKAYVTDEAFLRTYFITRRVYDVRGGNIRKPDENEV